MGVLHQLLRSFVLGAVRGPFFRAVNRSLRDLVTALDAGRKKLQQVGLENANRKRPQEIFGELFSCLYSRCRSQAPGQRFGFRHRVYSLDATVIDLCLKVFDWAKFRKRKGAIHLILDHGGHIPSFCVMTPGREHEIEVARGQRYEPDSILTFDRAYVDYHCLTNSTARGCTS